MPSPAAQGNVEAQPRPAASGEHVQKEVDRLQQLCQAADGGVSVMRGLHLCLLHSLPIPEWLAREFIARYLRVSDAQVGSWDDAFGRPYPKRTRLHVVRERRRLVRLVHSAVWQLSGASIHDARGVSINRILFDQVGEMRGIHCSGSKAERLYYEALAQGWPNVAELRSGMQTAAIPSQLANSEEGLG